MIHLYKAARHIRMGIIDTVYHQKQGLLGGPLSIADILAVLYFDTLDIDPKNPQWANRDRFVLSKGHAAIAQYVAMALRGYFPYEELRTFDDIGSRLQAHPDMRKLPGIDMSTGSLGQGFSAAVGMALGAKLQDRPFRTFTMIGDGESQEGQIWEAARVAQRYHLDNLIAIIDNNQLQQYGWKALQTIGQRTPPEKDHASKWRAFGWHVVEIDGHNIPEARMTLDALRKDKGGRPHMIVAHTVKGKGVPFMEGAPEWHAKVPTAEEYTRAIDALKEGAEDEE